MATIYLLATLGLIALSESKILWEPCKIQCDKNYAKNDISQEFLTSVCHRGCDMFTVALISTTQPEQPKEPEEILGPKALPQIEMQPELKESDEFNVHIIKFPLQGSNKISSRTPTPSANDQSPHPAEHHQANLHESSKTTVEPTSQPVQDHPVQENDHSTTTNGPKRTQLESHKKEMIEKFKKEPPIRIRLVETNLNILDGQELHIPKESRGIENEEAKENERLELAKHSCRHACVTAYGGATEQEACVVGCHLQATATIQSQSSNMMTTHEPFYKKPFAMIQKMFVNLAGKVSHLVKMTWSSHNNEEEGKVEVFGGGSFNPRAEVSFFEKIKPRLYLMEPGDKKPEPLQPEMYHALKAFKTDIFRFPSKLISHSVTLKNSRIQSDIFESLKNDHFLKEHHVQHYNGHLIHHQNHKKNEELVNEPKIHQPDHQNQNTHLQQQQQQLDLLECISRKSGLPRWFIATTIFASALVVLWLCFSLTAPPEDIRVVKTNVKPPESERLDEDGEEYDDLGGYTEKKTLLSRDDDVIKIRIENV